jgi:hypothetical protein
MLLGELAQNRKCLVPTALGLMWIYHRRRHHLACGVDHRDLDAGAEAEIEAHGGQRAGRGGE